MRSAFAGQLNGTGPITPAHAGRVREFVYDDLDREAAEKWMEGANVLRTVAFAYNAAGQLTGAGDADSAYAYVYDGRGRITSVDNYGTPNVPNVVLSEQYDANSNRTQLAATIGGLADFLNAYSYDGLNRLTQLVQQGQTGGNAVATKGAKLSYNLLGHITSIFRTSYFGVGPQPDIATSAFSYDGMNRLTGIAYTTNGGTATDAFSWTYDAASRVTSMSTTADGTATYSYDNTDQVTGASYTGTGQPANEAYSYDANGNRTNAAYATGTNNRLTSDGTFNYLYDAEGNRASRTRISTAAANDYLTTYAWDYRDRLTDVYFYNNSNLLTKHVHYTYDVFDHRISKSLDSTGSGSYDRIEDYVYDGNNVVLDFVDPDGAGPAPLALATRYLNGPSNTQLTDQVFAQEAASTGNVTWLLADNLGTTRDVVDNTGAVVGHFVYNSFGQLVSGPTNLTRYLYTGQAWDADVGLQYNWHRWYDPAVGRWISEDPIGFAARDANLSRYVGNQSLDYMDPNGENKYGFGIIKQGHVWVTIQNKVYNPRKEGTTTKDLYNLLQRFGNKKIKKLVIKGHGCADGIQDDNGDWYIRIYEDSTRAIMTIDGKDVDITDLLRQHTDETSEISIRGCWTAELAKKLAHSLGNGATVSGSPISPIGIPGTGDMIGPWKNYRDWWRVTPGGRPNNPIFTPPILPSPHILPSPDPY